MFEQVVSEADLVSSTDKEIVQQRNQANIDLQWPSRWKDIKRTPVRSQWLYGTLHGQFSKRRLGDKVEFEMYEDNGCWLELRIKIRAPLRQSEQCLLFSIAPYFPAISVSTRLPEFKLYLSALVNLDLTTRMLKFSTNFVLDIDSPFKLSSFTQLEVFSADISLMELASQCLLLQSLPTSLKKLHLASRYLDGRTLQLEYLENLAVLELNTTIILEQNHIKLPHRLQLFDAKNFCPAKELFESLPAPTAGKPLHLIIYNDRFIHQTIKSIHASEENAYAVGKNTFLKKRLTKLIKRDCHKLSLLKKKLRKTDPEMLKNIEDRSVEEQARLQQILVDLSDAVNPQANYRNNLTMVDNGSSHALDGANIAAGDAEIIDHDAGNFRLANAHAPIVHNAALPRQLDPHGAAHHQSHSTSNKTEHRSLLQYLAKSRKSIRMPLPVHLVHQFDVDSTQQFYYGNPMGQINKLLGVYPCFKSNNFFIHSAESNEFLYRHGWETVGSQPKRDVISAL